MNAGPAFFTGVSGKPSFGRSDRRGTPADHMTPKSLFDLPVMTPEKFRRSGRQERLFQEESGVKPGQQLHERTDQQKQPEHIGREYKYDSQGYKESHKELEQEHYESSRSLHEDTDSYTSAYSTGLQTQRSNTFEERQFRTAYGQKNQFEGDSWSKPYNRGGISTVDDFKDSGRRNEPCQEQGYQSVAQQQESFHNRAGGLHHEYDSSSSAGNLGLVHDYSQPDRYSHDRVPDDKDEQQGIGTYLYSDQRDKWQEGLDEKDMFPSQPRDTKTETRYSADRRGQYQSVQWSGDREDLDTPLYQTQNQSHGMGFAGRPDSDAERECMQDQERRHNQQLFSCPSNQDSTNQQLSQSETWRFCQMCNIHFSSEQVSVLHL